jgi:1-deoxy-D-xylulose-5-phosphate reductoisomerase
MRNIALLGSTGSIGRNALEVIRKNESEFKLISIAAGNNIELVERQIQEFAPLIVSVKTKSDAENLRIKYPNQKVFYGNNGLMEAVSHQSVDTMISAIDGTISLAATLESMRNNHRICLANKETIVVSGELILKNLDQSRAELIPIDSEQSAIFQCIGQNKRDYVKRVILTASGGPFFRKKIEELNQVTVEEALTHPTWSMGNKITIDSATLMNKALEIIEAFYLFRLKKNQVDVIIHPQSVIHSMVEFIDSSIIAQMSLPDMKLPILYSLTYPNRIPFNSLPIDFVKLRSLEFFCVDPLKFASIKLAYRVLEEGKNSGAVLNSANEVAVDYFLRGKLNFLEIVQVVEEIFNKEKFYSLNTPEDVFHSIETIKTKTENYINRMKSGENR